MPYDPWAYSGYKDPWAPSETAPGGLVGSIVRGVARDLWSVPRVAGALLFAPLDAAHVQVPITLADLDRRDAEGIVSLGALYAGGLLGNVVREALPALRATTTMGKIGARVVSTAAGEAAAGATYGTLKPLLLDQQFRPGEIVSDAAVFAGLGAVAGAATGAVKEGFIAKIARAKELQALARTATSQEQQILAQEMAGLKLLNPDTNMRVGIRRDGQGVVRATYYGGQHRVAPRFEYGPEHIVGNEEAQLAREGPIERIPSQTRQYATMDEALADAARGGFTNELGPFRTRTLAKVNFLDKGTLDAIQNANDDVVAAFGRMRLGEYQAVHEALREAGEANARLAALANEMIAPGEGLFQPIAERGGEKMSWAINAGIPKHEAEQMSMQEVLYEGFRKGLIDENLAFKGFNLEQGLRELRLNSRLPTGFVINPVKERDLYFGLVLTPQWIGDHFPIVSKLVGDGLNRTRSLNEYERAYKQWVFELEQTVPEDIARQGADLIDRSAYQAFYQLRGLPKPIAEKLDPVAMARQEALLLAKNTGNAQLQHYVDQVTSKLAEYRLRAASAGVLKEGIAGYMPIANVGQWKVDIIRPGAPKFEYHGHYDTQDEARSVLQTLIASGEAKGGAVSPNYFWYAGDGMVHMDPRQVAKMVEGMREVLHQTDGNLSAAELDDIRRKLGVTLTGKGTRKTAGNLQPRVLGMRDFSEDPFEALKIYGATVERAIQFADFDKVATAEIAKIPINQPNLIRFATRYKDDLLGRPRESEKLINSMIERMADFWFGGKLPVAPRAVQRYSAAIRAFETFSKLQSPMTALLNLTQLANTVAKLGVRDTVKGMSILANYSEWKRALETLERHGVTGISVITPLSETGQTYRYAKIRGAIDVSHLYGITDKRKWAAYKDVVFRSALFLFNETEKINRVVTAWGGYKSQLAKGATEERAAAYAQKLVSETQFEYSLANSSELLRGPIGAVLFQFKNWFTNEIQFFASLNKKEFVRFGAAMYALGGIGTMLNMPGGDLVDWASQFFFQKKLSEAVRLAPDPNNPLSSFVALGMPGVAHLDMSNYIGPAGVAQITRSLFGPGFGDLSKTVQYGVGAAAEKMTTGKVDPENFARWFQTVMPSAIKRVVRAQEVMSTDEVRDPYSGKLIYRPEGRFFAALASAVGTPTIEQAQNRVADQLIQRTTKAWRNARNAYGREYADAMLRGDVKEAEQVLTEANATGHALDGNALAYWMKVMRMPANERRRRFTPRQLRSYYQDLYDATGSLEMPF